MVCMPSHEVLTLYRAAAAAGVRLWVDGGWCVDALVGEQTREHDDLDVAVDRDDLAALVVVLNRAGYRRQSTDASTDWNFVMFDGVGRQVDIHVFHFDTGGRHVYGVAYPRESLQGSGVIAGEEVQCITAGAMYQFKTAYEPAAKDLADIRQLLRLLSYES